MKVRLQIVTRCLFGITEAEVKLVINTLGIVSTYKFISNGKQTCGT
jgi:hypothetical protein